MKKSGHNKYFLDDGKVTIVDVEELADKMIVWAKQPGVKILRRFVAEQGFPMATFFKWLEKSDRLRNAYDIARNLVGCNREEMAMQGKIPEKTFLRLQPLYDPEFKKLIEWENSIKNVATDSSSGNITITMQPFPTDDRVPRKEAIGFKPSQPTIGDSDGDSAGLQTTGLPITDMQRDREPTV